MKTNLMGRETVERFCRWLTREPHKSKQVSYSPVKGYVNRNSWILQYNLLTVNSFGSGIGIGAQWDRRLPATSVGGGKCRPPQKCSGREHS